MTSNKNPKSDKFEKGNRGERNVGSPKESKSQITQRFINQWTQQRWTKSNCGTLDKYWWKEKSDTQKIYPSIWMSFKNPSILLRTYVEASISMMYISSWNIGVCLLTSSKHVFLGLTTSSAAPFTFRNWSVYLIFNSSLKILSLCCAGGGNILRKHLYFFPAINLLTV